MPGMITLLLVGALAIGWTEIVLDLALGSYIPGAPGLVLLATYAGAGVFLGVIAGVPLLFAGRHWWRPLRFSLPVSALVAGYGIFLVYDSHGWAGEAAFAALCLVLACALAGLGRHLRRSRSWLLFRQIVWGVGLVFLSYAGDGLLGGGDAARRAFLLPLVVLVGELAWGGWSARWRRMRARATPSAGGRRAAFALGGSLLLVGTVLGAYREDQFSPLVWSQRARGVRRESPNLLLIVLDTTRADRLSLYGYPQRTTPNLEKLATDAAVFDRCVATSAWTLPTHASIFTGLFPSRHGAHLAGRWTEMRTKLGLPAVAWPLAEDKVTLAEILRAHGWATGAVVANFSYLFRDFGLAQGFDYYSDAPAFIFRRRPAIAKVARALWPSFLLKPYRGAPQINAEALSWLDKQDGGPFFLFVNYMEPHHPWLAEGENKRWWRKLWRCGRSRLDARDLYTHEVRHLSAEERAYISEQYDGEVAAMDRALGQLIEALRARNAYDDTLIVVVGDHGELLGEHSSVGHIGRMLYEELLWVPLVIKYPGSALKGRFTAPAQQVDVFPTVLRALGVAVPAGTQGQELPAVRHPIVAEQFTHGYLVKKYGSRYDRDLTAIYADGRKYIEGSDGDKLLFDLAHDPHEEVNLAASEPGKLKAAAAALERWTGSRPAPSATAQTTVTDGTRERLRALGYVN